MTSSVAEAEPVAPVQPPERGTDRYWRAAVLFTGALTLAGWLVRLTVKDRWLFLSTVFYATPLPLLTVGSLVCLVCEWRLKRRWRMRCWAVALMLSLSTWAMTDWRDQPQSSDPQELTVLFWNVARKKDMAPAADYIRKVDADIVGLVEAGWANEERRNFWSSHCPNHDISLLGGGLVLMSKGPSGKAKPGKLGAESIYRQIDCQVQGHDINCVVVDLKSDPYYSRKPVLGQLSAELAAFQSRPIIVMGDFNTPVDSLHYAPLRESMQEAFETSGKGYAPTWPWPAPVLWLDQIWVSRSIEVLSCQRLQPVHSDHCPVLCRIRIRPQQEKLP